MALFSIFKAPKHQKYKYLPRYYDPKKEEIETLINHVENRKAGNMTNARERISAGFRKGSSGYLANNRTYRSEQNNKSNKILLFTVIILVAITYVFLTVYLPDFMNALDGTTKAG